jgi:hypothetical protein
VNTSMGYSGQAKNSSQTVIPIFLRLLSDTPSSMRSGLTES